MKIHDKITPDGTRDILFEQCEAKRKIESNLARFFRHRGYDEVMTPGLEFYDVFYSNAAYFPQETMYKLTDSKGRLMVMRPDCTIPIARLMGTRLAGLEKPVRLYYDQNVYRSNPSMKGFSNEITQTGVELIGAGSIKADLEILELAASGLTHCSIENYRLEICHIGYFKQLMNNLEADDAEKEKIRELIESKNYAALGDVLKSYPESEAVTALAKLPELFGGCDVIDQAAVLFPNGKKVLDELRSVYESLQALGLGEKVIVDLGLVNQAEYYTGIIFRGYVEGVGEPVLSGGRYDKLMQDFGQPLPATGFAVNVNQLSRVLLEKGDVELPKTQVLLFSEKQCAPLVFARMKELVEQGIRCEYSLFDTLEQTNTYAKSKGIPTVEVL